jgi:hypothetical protein
MRLGFSLQVFEKYSNIKSHEIRLLGANSRFSKFCESAALGIPENSWCQEHWNISLRIFHLVLPDLITFVTFCEEWKLNIKTCCSLKRDDIQYQVQTKPPSERHSLYRAVFSFLANNLCTFSRLLPALRKIISCFFMCHSKLYRPDLCFHGSTKWNENVRTL